MDYKYHPWVVNVKRWRYLGTTGMAHISMKCFLWILVLGFSQLSFSVGLEELMKLELTAPSGMRLLPKSVVQVYPEDLVKKSWSVSVRVSDYEAPKRYYYYENSCPDEWTYVVIDGDRGEDIGWVEGQCQQVAEPSRPTIIRLATLSDVQRDRENQIEASRALEVLNRWKAQRPSRMSADSIAALGRMSFIQGRVQLDGKKITIYYSSEGWVQFPTLVQDLFNECFRGSRMRIWMQKV